MTDLAKRIGGGRCVLFAAALLGLIAAASSAAVEIRVGEPFPQIAMPTLDGELRSIADFRGRKVVLHVFASW